MPLPPTIFIRFESVLESDERTRTALAVVVGVLVASAMVAMVRIVLDDFKLAAQELVDETSGRRERLDRLLLA